MHRGSYPYKPTSEDRLIISKWKWRVGLAYGAILLVLLLVMIANPTQNRSGIAQSSAERGLSSALAVGNNRSR